MKHLDQRIQLQKTLKLLEKGCRGGALLTLALAFSFFAFRAKPLLLGLVLVFFITLNMVAVGSLLIVIREIVQFSAHQKSKKELLRVMLFFGSFGLAIFAVTAWFCWTTFIPK